VFPDLQAETTPRATVMSSLSPAVFSPRPFAASNSLYWSPKSQTPMTNVNQFSYQVSTDGVEVHHPQLDGCSASVAVDESCAEDPTSLCDVEEAACDSITDDMSTFIPEVEAEDCTSLPLITRRGKHLPALSLRPKVGPSSPDKNLSIATGKGNLIGGPLSTDKDKYEFIKQIGNDSEGVCTLVRDRNDHQLRVLKSVKYPQLASGKPIEAKILSEIFPERHNNIIQLHSHNDLTAELALVEYNLEYCSGGDLHDIIVEYADRGERFPEPFIWKVFLELAEALEFLHRGFDWKEKERPGIVHRDIKPSNIFLRRSKDSAAYPEAVIADFGSASFKFATYEPAGTFQWQPPEIPRKTPKGDVWSLGAIIHYMIHLIPVMLPFPRDLAPTEANRERWHFDPWTRQPIFDTPEMYSDELIEMMFVALGRDHNTRVSSSRLVRELRAAMGRQYPSNGDKIANPEPLAPWAFDHMAGKESASIKPNLVDKEAGKRQYFEMMDMFECPASSTTVLSPTY